MITIITTTTMMIFIIIFVIRILTVLLLCSVHQGQRSHATSLAEKYHDFGVLIELCETSGEQGTLQKYMTQFTDQVGMSIKPPSENVNDSLNSKCVFCCKRWSESWRFSRLKNPKALTYMKKFKSLLTYGFSCLFLLSGIFRLRI